MSGSLLHSSKWFLRPSHLNKPRENIPLHMPNNSQSSQSLQHRLSAEEEFYIRKCCPVTLSHLLPDLSLTQKSHLDDSATEFEVSMLSKLEKHLDESHRLISCSDSTLNEEETDEEKIFESCIENDINNNIILQNPKLEFRNKHLLKPHKVNYPDSNMKDFTLPALKLNNKYSILSDADIFSSTFPRAKIIQKMSTEGINFQRTEKDVNSIMLPHKNNKQIQPLYGEKDLSYTQTRRYKKSLINQNVGKHYNPFEASRTMNVPRIELDPSFPVSNSREDLFRSHQTTQPLLQPQYLPSHSTKPPLCVHHRRSRSLSPFKTTSLNSRFPALPVSEDELILPSPHLIQLARLKKEELELEEKMLLRQRQRLEIERLRPPEDKWYEMKNQKFHQEVHRNTAYLKNEKNLPLIQERRRQISDALMVTDY